MGMFWKNIRVEYLENVWLNSPGKHPGACPDPHAGLQVSTYSGYNFVILVNTQTHIGLQTHTGRQLNQLYYRLSQLSYKNRLSLAGVNSQIKNVMSFNLAHPVYTVRRTHSWLCQVMSALSTIILNLNH